MSDAATGLTTDPGLVPPAPVSDPTPEPEATSIADHASQFHPDAVPEGDGETPPDPHHSATQRRDKQTQQFAEGHRRRARSQQAGADDVPRIKELTGKWRSAEEERDRLKAELAALKTPAAAAAAPRESPRETPTPPAAPPASSASTTPARPDPANATKYPDGRYDPQYVEDLAEWVADRRWEAKQAEQQKQETQKSAEKQWNEGVNAARAQHADYDAVAFGPSRIQPGSIPDLWILEHKSGPLVLYHLQSHPQELDAIMRMDRLGQIEELASLTRRLASPSPVQAGTTGAAAGSVPVVIPPKPPTPVRAEASRASADPSTDESSSIAAHRKAYGRR